MGAWLTEVQNYDFVVYNQRPGRDLDADIAPKGLAGVSARLGELDVLAMHTRDRRAYLAECTTHLGGLQIGTGTDDAIKKLGNKLRVAGAYAKGLEQRTGLQPTLSVWSPKVSKGVVDRRAELEEKAGSKIEIVVNDAYAARVAELVEAATKRTTTTGNDVYRTLQLLTHLTRSPFLDLPTETRKKVSEAVEELIEQPDAQELSWREVVAVHRTQRGIHAPRGGSEASVICNTGPHAPYPDRFVGPDVLRYVGRGQEGDQALEGDNESLRQAIERGLPIRVFEAVGRNRYLDHGLWMGVGEPEWHLEPKTGRRLVVFVLRGLSEGGR